MHVSVGVNLQEGPWGGGNQFGHALVKHLRARGVRVSFDLKARDLDLIVLAEPRTELAISAYDDRAIHRYLRDVNPRVLVVHRINECDERKGSDGVNARLIAANRVADHTVFVSGWLRDLFLGHGIASRSMSVIFNGSDRTIFHPQGYRRWDGAEPLRLVTHHWGANWLKGFDIYGRLDNLLGDAAFRERFAFTYIGRLPEAFHFHHATYLEPLHGPQLAATLRSHHVYLTASQFEPGGNHQNEGALCGLPLLYRDSGCLPEYCAGYGLIFDADTFEEQLEAMRARYANVVDRMPDYPRTSEATAAAYHALFVDLLARRRALLRARPWRDTPRDRLRRSVIGRAGRRIRHAVQRALTQERRS